MRCSIVSLPAKPPTDRLLAIDFYAAALGEAATREACENLTKPNIEAAIVANLAERGTARMARGRVLTAY